MEPDVENRIALLEQELEARTQALEQQIKENKDNLIEQEHRGITVFSNLFHVIWNKKWDSAKPALKAVGYFFLPGKTFVFITGGSIIGLITVLLMIQNNDLVATQNFELQNQIYVQANSDRRTQIAQLTNYLYQPTEESLAKVKAQNKEMIVDSKKEQDRFEPHYMPKIRSEALKQMVELTAEPLKKPVKKNNETLNELAKKWGCVYLSIGCRETQADSESMTESKEQLRPILNLSNAFLSNVSWPDTSNVMIIAIDADLTGATLADADLTGADLTYATLADADLTRANLNNAYLPGANLSGANLIDVYGLTCRQLTRAKNWKEAITDLKCDTDKTTTDEVKQN